MSYRRHIFSSHAHDRVPALRALRATIAKLPVEQDRKSIMAAKRAEVADLLFALSEPVEGAGK